jgi:alkaline phosphatase D
MRILTVIILALFVVACQTRENIPHSHFLHGVASGDPLTDRVIIWTRITPEDSTVTALPVTWQVALDRDFKNIVRSEEFKTSVDRDFTVKVDVDSLQPGTYYFYRFIAGEHTSPIGRTKTTSATASDSLRFAIVSCSNWEWGYFNAYGLIAQKEVDAVIHLGDYIYEYGTGAYGDTTIGRINNPLHEIVSLQDYRTRHAQYRTDEGLQAMSQQHPIIAIWDDHEVANNSYVAGAQNHQPEEGDYLKRKAAARQAYYEWLPIREDAHLYRRFDFGPLADLFMLDERLEGREAPPAAADSASFERSMLGTAQRDWLESGLEKSTATWKVIGNQVMFSYMDLTGSPYGDHNLDSWEGYEFERNHIGRFIKDKNIGDVVLITGDTHASWAFDVVMNKKEYNAKTGTGAFAVEFGAPSVSSANVNEYKPDSVVLALEAFLVKQNPHLKFANERDHGYLLLSLYADRAKGEWFFVETLRQPLLKEKLAVTLQVQKGSHQLK